MAFAGRYGSTAAQGLLPNDKDVSFPADPEDTISALRWSPVSNHLAAACWDAKVYIYDATNPTTTGNIKGVAAITGSAPFFDCDFSKVSPR